MLLSGINRGANLAEDVTYSGTAAAAMEGALLGIRSIALSQVFTIGGEAHWATARRFAPPILEKLLTCDWEPGSFRQREFSRHAPREASDPLASPRRVAGCPARSGRCVASTSAIFPITGSRLAYKTGALEVGTDLHAIADNAVSVTPMQLDFTSSAFHQYLNRAFEGL